MTTRINGREYHTHSKPSGDSRQWKLTGSGPAYVTREYMYHANLFKQLDAYLATTPGTKEAEKKVRKIRRT